MPSQFTQVDLSTRNTLSEQLANINLNQENIIVILNALNDIATGNVSQTTINVTNQDGSVREITLRSNAYLMSEIDRLSNTLKALQNLDPSKGTTIVDESGQHRKIFVGSYAKAPHGNVADIKKSTSISIDNKSLIWNLMFPSTSVVFSLPTDFILIDRVIVKTFRCSNEQSFSYLRDDMEYAEVMSLYNNNRISGTWYEDVVETNIRQQRYYGKFDILSIDKYNSDGSIAITVLDTHYSDINSISNSRELYAGDVLVSKTGNSKYKIVSVDHYTHKLVIEQTYGLEALNVGVGALEYLYEIPDETRELHVPIHGSEKSIYFLSPVNTQSSAAGNFSKGYLVNTADMVVYENNIATPFDTYYNNRVVNIGSYLEQLLSENTIPYSQGIKPDKPALSAEYLTVIQINKHLSDNSTVQKIEQLSSEKEKMFADITALNSQIADVNARINAGRYRSLVDRKADENRLQNYINQKTQLSTTYASLVSDIASKVNEDDLSGFTPKFRVRGFFPIQSPIQSSVTRAQHIIKYLIQYRYCTPNTDDSTAVILPYKDENGNEIHGTFSAWVNQESPSLHKVRNLDGTISWEANNVESGDEININQIDIPIKSGESVEIRVKALSEAGYPVTYTESDWSDIVRVDFPASLQDFTSINETVEKNTSDRQKVELQQILKDMGLDDHLFTSFKEQDNYFAHNAHVIASGFKTTEQTTISLFEYLVSLENKVKALQEQLTNAKLNATITIEDEEGNSYSVQNFATIKLNAGVYANHVAISNSAQYGGIMKKTFYIKITNNNGSAIDMSSPCPGQLSSNVPVSSEYYLPLVKIIPLDNDDAQVQYNGQVICFRKKDLTDIATSDMYIVSSEKSNTTIPTSDIDTSVTIESGMNAIDSTGKVAKLNPNISDDLVVLNTFHPVAIAYLNNKTEDNLRKLKQVFDRLATYNSLLRTSKVQQAYPNVVAYDDNDKFAIGQNSTGARLYPVINNVANIQVAGNKANDTKILQPSDTSSIIIPLVFECRLQDARGYILGDYKKNISDNFYLTKKVGVDLQIGTTTFKFDVEVTCSLLEEEGVNQTLLNTIIDKINPNDTVTPSIS